MILAVQYLQTDKNGILNYRRKFPKDLVRFIPSASPTGKGRVEFKVSLRAKSINEAGAMDRYRTKQREFDEIVADATRKKAAYEKRTAGAFDELDTATIAALAARYHALELASDDSRRRDPDSKEVAREVTHVMQDVGFEFPSVPEAAEWTLSIRTAHEAIRAPDGLCGPYGKARNPTVTSSGAMAYPTGS